MHAHRIAIRILHLRSVVQGACMEHGVPQKRHGSESQARRHGVHPSGQARPSGRKDHSPKSSMFASSGRLGMAVSVFQASPLWGRELLLALRCNLHRHDIVPEYSRRCSLPADDGDTREAPRSSNRTDSKSEPTWYPDRACRPPMGGEASSRRSLLDQGSDLESCVLAVPFKVYAGMCASEESPQQFVFLPRLPVGLPSFGLDALWGPRGVSGRHRGVDVHRNAAQTLAFELCCRSGLVELATEELLLCQPPSDPSPADGEHDQEQGLCISDVEVQGGGVPAFGRLRRLSRTQASSDELDVQESQACSLVRRIPGTRSDDGGGLEFLSRSMLGRAVQRSCLQGFNVPVHQGDDRPEGFVQEKSGSRTA